MALQYSPKIVTDSLVMCLDASQNKSYPTTDLPVKGGLVMWLDAADDTTFSYSSGTVVSQWRDKSGLNNHVAQSTVANQPSRSSTKNSRKTVVFDGSNDNLFNSGNVFPSNTADYTKIAVVFQTSTGSTGNVISSKTGTAGSNFAHAFYFGNSTSIRLWHDTDFVVSNVALNTNTLGIISGTYVNSSGSGALYVNGTAAGTGTAANRNIVRDIQIGSIVDCCFFTGEICEVLVFSRVLSDTERKQVHTYLGQKWGISNTDRSIVDLSGFNDNGLFGNGTVANMPDYDFYNKGALTFNGTSDYAYQSLFNNAITATLTFDVWVKFSDTGSSGRYIMSLGRDIGVPSGGIALLAYGFSSASSGQIIFEFGSGYGRVSSGIVPTTDIWYNLTVTADGTNTRFYVNSVLANTASQTTGAVASSPGLSIGSYLNGATPPIPGTYFFNGNIGSVKIYNKTLSQAEISQNYEAQKSKFANTIVQQGLVLNLDAGNPYSYAGAGTTWYDVSGNGNNGTFGASTAAPTYNTDAGGNIVFDGSNDYVAVTSAASIKNTSTLSLEGWVFISSAMNYYGGIVGKGTSDTDEEYCLLVHSVNSKVYMDVGSGGGPYTDATFSFSLNTWYHIIGTHERVAGSSTIKIYVNGSLLSSSTVNPTNAVNDNATNVSVGSRFNGGTSVWNGKIATARIYNRTLSAAEVLQNYNATKGRFGLL